MKAKEFEASISQTCDVHKEDKRELHPHVKEYKTHRNAILLRTVFSCHASNKACPNFHQKFFGRLDAVLKNPAKTFVDFHISKENSNLPHLSLPVEMHHKHPQTTCQYHNRGRRHEGKRWLQGSLQNAMHQDARCWPAGCLLPALWRWRWLKSCIDALLQTLSTGGKWWRTTFPGDGAWRCSGSTMGNVWQFFLLRLTAAFWSSRNWATRLLRNNRSWKLQAQTWQRNKTLSRRWTNWQRHGIKLTSIVATSCLNCMILHEFEECRPSPSDVQARWCTEGSKCESSWSVELPYGSLWILMATEEKEEPFELAHLGSRRAELLMRLNRPRAALRDCSRALELNPDSGKAWQSWLHDASQLRNLGEYWHFGWYVLKIYTNSGHVQRRVKKLSRWSKSREKTR